MSLADRPVIWLNNVMRRGMHRGQHVAELVKIRQVIQRRVPPRILQIAQIGRPRHRHKNGVVFAKGQVIGRVTRVVCEGLWNGRDQITHQTPVEIHHLADNLSPGALPVFQCDVIAKLNADVFQDIHRCRIDLFDLFGRHRLG